MNGEYSNALFKGMVTGAIEFEDVFGKNAVNLAGNGGNGNDGEAEPSGMRYLTRSDVFIVSRNGFSSQVTN